MRTTLAAFLLALTACSGPAPEPESAVYFPPPDAAAGWRALETPEQVRRVGDLDPAKLDAAFDYVQGSTKNGGLVVVRRGWLAYERYFGLGHREATPNLASVGKSFTSVAVGILMDERPELFPDGLDQRVFTPDYLPAGAFPLADPAMAEIRLGQLLSFTAGIRGNNPSYVDHEPVTIDPPGPDGYQGMIDEIAWGKRDGEANGVQTTASSLWTEPGGGYSYATASIHLASAMLRHVSGRELEAFVRERIAEPVGFGRFGWGYQNRPGVDHTPGGGGIAVRATDMARFGYLLLNEGRWGERQIIPADYVRRCAQTSPYNPHYPYSLQFHVNTNGERPGLPRDAFWKTGSGGHALYVVPSLELVVWKLGGRDGQYSPEDTGLERHPDAPAEAPERDGWTERVDAGTAAVRTLEMVVGALVE